MQSELDPKFLDEVREKFASSFYYACVAVFECQFPARWLDPAVHKPVCDLISDHTTNTRVGVVLPRDWLKSTVCSVYYPIWRAMLDDSFTCMVVQNTFTNASKKLGAIRQVLLHNKLLRALYPGRMPTPSCKISGEAICLPRDVPLPDETFEAAGVSSDLTSRHVSLIIEDDTVAPEYDQMDGNVYEPSNEQIEKAIGFHRSAEFLLHDLETSQRLIVGTRWRERDLFTWVEENEPDYKFLIRAVRENEKGEPDHEGRLTYPSRFNDKVLARIKNAVGDYMFQALMMSLPLSSVDSLFDTNRIQLYDEVPTDLQIFTAVDPAPPDSKSSDPDYNVVLTGGICPRGIFILEYWRDRATPGQVIDTIFDHYIRYSPLRVGIEAVQYQKTLAWWTKEKQNERRQWFNISELRTGRVAKPMRIRSLEPIINNSQLHIRPYMNDLRQEVAAFPKGAHDDILDALAYLVEMMRNNPSVPLAKQETGPARYTGEYYLNQITSRNKRPNQFPYDMMGVTGSGTLLANRDPKLFESCYIFGAFGSKSVYNY